MKAGRTLVELAHELTRQHESKRDFVADTRRLSLVPDQAGQIVMEGVNGGMTLRPSAHAQLAATLGIPKPYYDRMQAEAPDLLASNANRWLQKAQKKLIRTLDGEVRAILSDSYRPLDNLDLANAVLPILKNVDARVESAEVTESKLYLKVVSDRIQGEAKVGDLMQAGAVIGNSEIGHGSLSVSALDFRLACLNGMIRETAIRKAHLGRGARGMDAIEDAREFFKDTTRQLDDQAFFAKVQDTVSAMFDPERFNLRLNQYREASAQIITIDPVKAIETVTRRYSFTDGERGSIMSHLIQGGDLSRWGLANAVTRAAQDVDSYDRSTEMERFGGDIIELAPADWKVIATTA